MNHREREREREREWQRDSERDRDRRREESGTRAVHESTSLTVTSYRPQRVGVGRHSGYRQVDGVWAVLHVNVNDDPAILQPSLSQSAKREREVGGGERGGRERERQRETDRERER